MGNLTASDALTLFIMVFIFGVAALMLGITVGILKSTVARLEKELITETKERKSEDDKVRNIVERMLLKGGGDV